MTTAYITAPPDSAPEIASALVEEGLAACVNRFECYGALESRVVELHPYDVPCIERFDEAETLDAFGDWIEDSVE